MFEVIRTMVKQLTVNEDAPMSNADAEKEAKAMMMKYNKDIEEREKEIGKVYIPLEEKENGSFIPEARVNETFAQEKVTGREQISEKEKQIGE